MARAPKQKASQQESALAEVSHAQWRDYQARFRPAEIEMIKRSEFTAGERAEVEGAAGADAAQAFKGLTRNTVSAAGQAGANAASGKVKMSLAGDADAFGEARGLARSAAGTGGEVDASQQKLRIASLGRNIASGVTADMARGARRSSALARAAADAKFQRNADMANLAMAVGGASLRKYQIDKAYKAKQSTWGPLATEKPVIPDAIHDTLPGLSDSILDLSKDTLAQWRLGGSG